MSERPILFSGPMVRAILAGKKTQTRRVVKFSDEPAMPIELWRTDGQGTWYAVSGLAKSQGLGVPETDFIRCPYGALGDTLWVKETWRTAKTFDASSPTEIATQALNAGYQQAWGPVQYIAGGDNGVAINDFGAEWGKTRVSIHMPRWASRITLRVTDVRVERLQGISARDAVAEGVVDDTHEWDGNVYYPLSRFRDLWDSINGKRAPWATNPWVWVVSFERVTP